MFDDAGRLESINHKRSDESVIYTQDNVFDKIANITSKTTGLGTTSYDYDNLYQLNTATHPTQPQEDFTYDPVGNRLTSTDHSDWGYNDRNQLVGYNGTAFIYDLNGNTIAKMDTTGTTGYTYNYANRLTRVGLPGGGYAEYKYDVRGRRIEKDVNGTVTKYLYDGDSLLAEYDNSDALQRNYFYGAGDINPSILFENSTMYFYHHDHLNTPQKVTDESGTIVWEATYNSFGEANITTETISNNFRFPGQYYDQESELHYNYFRYYDPTTGRYLREDPIGLEGGINLYGYVKNNPINLIDVLGLFGDDIGPWWPPWDPPIAKSNKCVDCDWPELENCVSRYNVGSAVACAECAACLAGAVPTGGFGAVFCAAACSLCADAVVGIANCFLKHCWNGTIDPCTGECKK